MSLAPWIYQTPLEWSRPAEPERVVAPVVLRDDIATLRASLTGALARKITTATELRRARDLERRTHFPTMFGVIDGLLGGGLERGKLVELQGRRSTGRFSVVLAALASATEAGEAAALVDVGDGLDPQVAASVRIDLQRLLWVRPESLKHAVMSAELLIQTGFPLVVVDLGIQLRGRRPHEATWVRLARAAEHHGAALLVSTPYPVSGTAADVVISAERSRPTWSGTGAAPRLLNDLHSSLRVEKQRGSSPGAHAELEVTSGDKPRRKAARTRVIGGTERSS